MPELPMRRSVCRNECEALNNWMNNILVMGVFYVGLFCIDVDTKQRDNMKV